MKRLKRAARILYNKSITAIDRLGKKPILAIGDSHAAVFNHPRARLPKHYFNTCSVVGATISGLENPNSQTQALPVFQKSLSGFSGQFCVVQLGEVDTGFVIWYRAKKHNLRVDEILEQTVTNYLKFINSIPKSIHPIVISAPLPTIQDGQNWGEVANLRKEVDAPLSARTKLTFRLNQAIENESGRFSYLNLDPLSTGEDGLVDKSLLSTDPNDHHYDQAAYLSLLLKPLESIISAKAD